MEKQIKFPKHIKNDIETISFLNELLSDKNKEMHYYMSEIKVFEASIIPYFHSLICNYIKHMIIFFMIK